MAVDFCDYFWGEEHNGWNVLYQNMKQGLNASKELAEFFKERWSIDETYCKSLLKLANKANINSEKGTLSPLFALLKNSSEKMSTIHFHMVNRIQDLVKDIIKYNEELHKKHKQVKDEEAQTEDIMKNIQGTSGLAQKAKETYSQRYQDLERAKREGASPKDIEKAESKCRKAQDDYKALIEKYNTTRDEFEKKMLQSCRRFQIVEETHLSQILLFIQTYICVLQSDQNAMAEILQELMNKYSEFSIEKLLDTFALSKLTGLERPVMMVLEDTSSLGSAISGQQSPEPADQSKSSADDAASVGGEKGSSGGVLTGGKEREWSAPPKLKVEEVCSEGEAENGGKGQNGSLSEGSPPQWPAVTSGSLPTSPTKVTSAPSSPTGVADDSAISRSLFRSSKLPLTGSGPVLSFGFLRSRRDKKKEKKAKKKKTDDTSSNKDEKSDNENSEEARTVDLLSIGAVAERKEEPEGDHGGKEVAGDSVDASRDDSLEQRLQDSSTGLEDSKLSATSGAALIVESDEPKVDEDGYSIKPQMNRGHLNRDASFDSSSESDSEIGIEKKIHVEIKPITNGAPPISASVDELRATIEGMSLLPSGFATHRSHNYGSASKHNIRFLTLQKTKKSPWENQNNSGMRRSTSVAQQAGSGSVDLLGLNLNFSGSSSTPKSSVSGAELHREGSGNISRKSSPYFSSHMNTPSPLSFSFSYHNMSDRTPVGNSPPILPIPKRSDRYAELSEILGDTSSTESVPPVLPPRGSSSRGSTPTPTMALPRPSSRKSPSTRSVHSPATVSVLSRAESISSLEFRTSGIPTGLSRGPSPLTIGMSDTIPLAVAFQELCHTYFRGTDESRMQMKVTGEMMVSFPSGIVGVLANNPTPSQLSFKVQNFSRMTNPLPNRQLISFDESQSSENCGVYNFDMNSLSSLLRKQADQNPTASYFNVDIIKYQVSKSSSAESSPLHLVSYWRCEDAHTDLRVDYSYNSKSMSNPSPLLNLTLSVPIDGIVKNMHSKPTGQWLKDQQKAVWKFTELSQHSSDGGKGSLRGKFEVAAGPTTPATVAAQFNCEGTTLSGVEFALAGPGYRVSLVKKRFVSGKYICDADAVLRHRYGSLTR